MPELATYILIITLFGGHFQSPAVTHVEGFTEMSCTDAAIRVNAQLNKKGHAFCIARIGRKY